MNKIYLMDCLEGMRRYLKDNEEIYKNFLETYYLKDFTLRLFDLIYIIMYQYNILIPSIHNFRIF